MTCPGLAAFFPRRKLPLLTLGEEASVLLDEVPAFVSLTLLSGDGWDIVDLDAIVGDGLVGGGVGGAEASRDIVEGR